MIDQEKIEMVKTKNDAYKMMSVFLLSMVTLLISHSLWADQIGSVSTKFKILGANDKIVIEAFDDPDVPGATCYLSRAKTGGVGGPAAAAAAGGPAGGVGRGAGRLMPRGRLDCGISESCRAWIDTPDDPSGEAEAIARPGEDAGGL